MLETVYLGGILEGKSRKWWFESIWGPKGAPYGQKRGDFGGFGAPPGGAADPGGRVGKSRNSFEIEIEIEIQK